MATGSHVIRFPADPGSIAAARQFAAAVISPLDPDLRDAAVLLVSELATNAVRHGRSPFVVDIRSVPFGARVEVSDLGPAWHTTGHPPRTGTSGRGLVIVDGIADSWGVETGPTDVGKTVWFELSAAQGANGGNQAEESVGG